MLSNMPVTSQTILTKSFTISVCIATHERSLLLKRTLDALSRQTRLPDEIVISYFSERDGTRTTVQNFKQGHKHLIIKNVQSKNKSLPYQRWWAYSNSMGEVVLFLDDDVTLEPTAVQVLESAYVQLCADNPKALVAGIGFFMTFPDGTTKQRRPKSLEERWLGIKDLPSGKIGPGGLSAPLKSLRGSRLHEVDRLSGGAMSFRRQVLSNIGLLGELVKLYDLGIGKGEDAVLSYYAHQIGNLYVLPNPLAIHPPDSQALNTAYATTGWRKGLAETWGRAHTLRWMSSNDRAYWWSWFRIMTLEVLVAMPWGILRKPFSLVSWTRLAGGLYGCLLTMLKHSTIPPLARSL